MTIGAPPTSDERGDEHGGEAPCYAHLLDPLAELSETTLVQVVTESASAVAIGCHAPDGVTPVN